MPCETLRPDATGSSPPKLFAELARMLGQGQPGECVSETNRKPFRTLEAEPGLKISQGTY